MSPKQKLVIALLAMGNVLVIAALLVSVVQHARSANVSVAALPAPTAAPVATVAPRATPIDRYTARALAIERDCTWRAVQLMAYTGLRGTVAWAPGGALDFELVFPLGPVQPTDVAAQAVWTAFDIGLALQQVERCAGFRTVSVDVLVLADQSQHEISVGLSADDLAAYGAGALTDDELAARAAYSVRTQADE